VLLCPRKPTLLAFWIKWKSASGEGAEHVDYAGESGERRLSPSDGEAERFYPELKQRGSSVRVGMEATGYAR